MDKFNDVAAAVARELNTSDWQLCLRIARAAVLALREPTPGMLEAAVPMVPDWGELPDDWRRMIDFVVQQH